MSLALPTIGADDDDVRNSLRAPVLKSVIEDDEIAPEPTRVRDALEPIR